MLSTIRDLVTLGNSYLKEKEDKNEPCNRALLKNIAVYFTQIFNILGLNSKPEEIGFSSSTESGGANKEELVMPYLQTLATFRENVRKEAIGNFNYLVHSRAENLKKSRQKKLVKSNKYFFS